MPRHYWHAALRATASRSAPAPPAGATGAVAIPLKPARARGRRRRRSSRRRRDRRRPPRTTARAVPGPRRPAGSGPRERATLPPGLFSARPRTKPRLPRSFSAVAAAPLTPEPLRTVHGRRSAAHRRRHRHRTARQCRAPARAPRRPAAGPASRRRPVAPGPAPICPSRRPSLAGSVANSSDVGSAGRQRHDRPGELVEGVAIEALVGVEVGDHLVGEVGRDPSDRRWHGPPRCGPAASRSPAGARCGRGRRDPTRPSTGRR